MQSPFRPDLFADKRVVITGGASGIGLAVSEAFAAHGADVILVSRNEERLQAACNDLADRGPGTMGYHVADVRDAERIHKIGKQLWGQGDVHVLVNGAAGNFVSPFAAMSRNAWESVIDIVLNGTRHTTASIAQPMFENQVEGASIINIVAGYAWTGAPGVSHSGAAKAGVLNLTKSLAVEWAPHVRSNALSPGPIDDTEGMKRLADDFGLRNTVEESVPLGRMGQAEEITHASLFLASDAASYITGACLPIDGGQDAMGPFGKVLAALG